MLLEVLYYIFIFPLEQVLDSAIGVFYHITKGYGISIILLSVCINLFLLKLVLYFDTKAQAVNALKKECDGKIAEFKRVFKGAELQTYIRTLYRQKHFYPIYTLQGLGGLALQIPFFIALIHLIQNATYLKDVSFLWITDLSQADSVMLFGVSLHILPLLMTFFTLINVMQNTKDRGARIQGVCIALLFLVLLYEMPSALVLYWTCNMLFVSLKEIYKRSTFAKGHTHTIHSKDIYVFSHNIASRDIQTQDTPQIQRHKSKFYSMLFNIFTPYSALDSKIYMTYRNISIIAILNICFMVCVFSPFAVYSSDVSQFDSTQTYQTLGALFGFFLLSSFVLIYLTSFFYKSRLLKIGVFVVGVILCMGIIYTFVLDYNVVTGKNWGVMEEMMFLDTHRLFSPYNKYVDLLVGVICLGIVAFLLQYEKYMYIACQIVFFSIILSAFIYMFNIFNISQVQTSYSSKKLDSDTHIASFYPNPYLSSFARDNLNIVVLMLDAFTGSHFDILLEQNPLLKIQLDGFVYYRNTTTASSFTYTSLPSVFGGDYYSAYNINLREVPDLQTERNNAILNIVSSFLANGFEVGVDIYSIDKDYIASRIEHNKESFAFNRDDDYNLALFETNHHYSLEKTLENFAYTHYILGSLISYGIFKFVPYSGKVRILMPEENRWRIQFGSQTFGSLSSSVAIKAATQHIAQLSSIVDETHLNSTNKPTLKFIANLLSHDSFVLDIHSCKPTRNSQPMMPEAYRGLIPPIFWGKYNSEVCAFREIYRLIESLKKLQVYDNTLFVVVSDHGRADSYPQLKVAGDKFPGYYTDTLLLIKMPNMRGELSFDDRLMINSDVAGIICENIGGCKNVSPSILKQYPKKREVIHFYPKYFTSYQQAKTHYIMDSLWKVGGSVYDPLSWQDITQEVKNGTLKYGIEH